MSLKKIVKSLTIKGLALTSAGISGSTGIPTASFLEIFGLNVGASDVDTVIAAIGIIIAAYGRWRAKEPLGEVK